MVSEVYKFIEKNYGRASSQLVNSFRKMLKENDLPESKDSFELIYDDWLKKMKPQTNWCGTAGRSQLPKITSSDEARKLGMQFIAFNRASATMEMNGDMLDNLLRRLYKTVEVQEEKLKEKDLIIAERGERIEELLAELQRAKNAARTFAAPPNSVVNSMAVHSGKG